MVYFIRKLIGSLKSDKSVKARNMKIFLKIFLTDVAPVDLKETLGSSGDVNVLVQQLSSIILLVIEKQIPPPSYIRVSESTVHGQTLI